MAYFAPPAKNEISATPSPTNAAHNAGLGKLWDMITNLFGTTGKPAEAFAAMKLFDSKTLLNLKPTFGVGSNALTITLKDKDAVDLAENNPGFVAQRHATVAEAGFNLRKIAANLSLVVSAGSTLGHVANVLTPVYIYLIDNAGAQELAVTSAYQGESAIVSTTAEGGTGAADSATVIYSTTARAGVPARLLAVAWFKQAVAGNWVNLPTRLHAAPFLLSVPNDRELLRSVVLGLETANNATDAANDIDINAGSILDSRGLEVMVLSSLLTKQIDAAWAVGHNQGGMLTGAVANDTWYGLWLIGRSDTGVVDAGFDPSLTTPTLPANYDRARLIGRVRRDTATNRAYYQVGNIIYWRARRQILSAGGATAETAVTYSSAVPTDALAYQLSGLVRFLQVGNMGNQFVQGHIRVVSGSEFEIFRRASNNSVTSSDRSKDAGFPAVRVPNTGNLYYLVSEDQTQSRSLDLWISAFEFPR